MKLLCPNCGEAVDESLPAPLPGESRLDFVRYVPVLVMLLLSLISSGILTPHFAVQRNLTNIFATYIPNGFAALGMAIVIFSGKVDFSIPSVMALSGWLFVHYSNSGMFWLPAMILPIAVAMVVGVFHGLVSGVLRVPSWCLTLGTAFLLRGFVSFVTSGMLVKLERNDDVSSMFRFSSNTGSAVVFVVVLIALAVAAHLLLRRSVKSENTVFRRHFRVTASFAVCSACAGIAGILMTIRMGAAMSVAFSGYEVDYLAAAALGGMCLRGGRGSVIGPLFGCLVLTMSNNVLALTGISAYVAMFVKAAILIGALIINVCIERFVIDRGMPHSPPSGTISRV